MPDSPAIAVFVLLALPGLLALGVYQALTPTKAPETSTQIVLAIVLSTLSYLAVGLLHTWAGWIPDPAVLLDASGEHLSSVFASKPLWVVASACVVSLLIGLGMAFLTCKEWPHGVCRRYGITRKFGYASHWDAVVHTKGKGSWIAIRFQDGAQFLGMLDSHSDSSDERSLLLSNVRKVKEDESYEDWDSNDYLFIPDISALRSMRIHVPPKEPASGKTKASKPTAI